MERHGRQCLFQIWHLIMMMMICLDNLDDQKHQRNPTFSRLAMPPQSTIRHITSGFRPFYHQKNRRKFDKHFFPQAFGLSISTSPESPKPFHQQYRFNLSVIVLNQASVHQSNRLKSFSRYIKSSVGTPAKLPEIFQSLHQQYRVKSSHQYRLNLLVRLSAL